MSEQTRKAVELSTALIYAENEETRLKLAAHIVQHHPQEATAILAGLANFAADAESNALKLRMCVQRGGWR